VKVRAFIDDNTRLARLGDVEHLLLLFGFRHDDDDPMLKI
jgi:hypothetical protein